jgi:triphosphoribosyl-dephospho-CoA synthase
MTSPAQPLSIGQCATLACLLEATAPKAGNVHRGIDFEDLSFTDFAIGSVAIAPAMEAARTAGIGQTVLDAVAATRRLAPTNVNLGIALLLAPLAAVPREQPLSSAAVHAVLSALTPTDCHLTYAAIRLAAPGGMGRVEQMDVADDAPDDLLAAMRAAAERDLIALQYAEDFRLVLTDVLPALVAGRETGWSLTETIIHTHLHLLSRHADSLIVRKCGPETARQVSVLAGQALDTGSPGDEAYYAALADFDFWLRADGHRRNPGTTADLIAAGLFAGLRDGLIPPPWR